MYLPFSSFGTVQLHPYPSMYQITMQSRAFEVIIEKRKEKEKDECIDRESNPELGHGKTQCYRYTINAWSIDVPVDPWVISGQRVERVA